jgi:hypothetical protein
LEALQTRITSGIPSHGSLGKSRAYQERLGEA